MDATRFDTLTRTMAAPTRRAALRGLAGVLLGALAAASPVARRTTTVLACDPDGTDCSNDISCCSGFCDTAPPVGDGTFGKCAGSAPPPPPPDDASNNNDRDKKEEDKKKEEDRDKKQHKNDNERRPIDDLTPAERAALDEATRRAALESQGQEMAERFRNRQLEIDAGLRAQLESMLGR